MNTFLILLSTFCTTIIIYFNKDIFSTFNFTLCILLDISFLMFFQSFMSYFSFEALDKTNLISKNKRFQLKLQEILLKNREVINLYNSLRKEFILLTLKNAHLTLVISSLTKNKEVFDRTIKDLELLGIEEKTINKFGNLINLINLIDSKKVEIVVVEGEEGKKIIFKEISS